jgi:hypothetical protein
MKPEVLERIRAVKRASQVLRAGTWRMHGAIDQVVLDADTVSEISIRLPSLR